ncbi:MAG TPA: CUAEP/CCAEP-tail radical SAM protein, partial [Acidobacteriota bacterium]|nr:CUAEP/CCAEP-tail radical SAM protein [Acidobacteriota bacterium]
NGTILLISCYELGHQPMGLALPAAFLERAGFTPVCLDLAVEGLDEETARRAAFVGVSVPMHTALRLGLRAALGVRQANPDCHICFFGLYALLNAEYLLGNVANSVIGGEYEQPLTELVRALHESRPPDVEGVATRGRTAPPYLRRLMFPIPQRAGLPPPYKYARLETAHGRLLAGYTEASRGCRHLCLHCPIPPLYGGRFFVVPREIVLEDIRRQVQTGIRHVTFGDPDFLNGPKHSLGIVQVMHEEFPRVTFDFTAKIEHLVRHGKLLVEFARRGCLFIVSAAESLSDNVLANLGKGHTRRDFLEVLRMVRMAGISLRPSFVSFTPWTSLQDYIDVLDLVEREELLDSIDPIQYAVRLLVPPGSLLLSQPALRPFLGPIRPQDFCHPWTHPDPRMDKLHQDVTRLASKDAAEGTDPRLTFARIRELAESSRDEREPELESLVLPQQPAKPLRLTEPWFC